MDLYEDCFPQVSLAFADLFVALFAMTFKVISSKLNLLNNGICSRTKKCTNPLAANWKEVLRQKCRISMLATFNLFFQTKMFLPEKFELTKSYWRQPWRSLASGTSASWCESIRVNNKDKFEVYWRTKTTYIIMVKMKVRLLEQHGRPRIHRVNTSLVLHLLGQVFFASPWTGLFCIFLDRPFSSF